MDLHKTELCTKKPPPAMILPSGLTAIEWTIPFNALPSPKPLSSGLNVISRLPSWANTPEKSNRTRTSENNAFCIGVYFEYQWAKVVFYRLH
ncbi:MAG TPA: hypothetical protein PLU49_13680 [Saprospiraceae bacterium]|nr:hypothetical protein [Saprospiraceae bacterium]